MFEFSMDVGLDAWTRCEKEWEVELPYLTFGGAGTYRMSYGRGHDVELVVVTDRCVSTYTMKIPGDAIWALRDFDDPKSGACVDLFDGDSTVRVSLPHVDSERFHDTWFNVRIAVDEDNLSEVRTSMSTLREMWARVDQRSRNPFILCSPMEHAQSNEVIAELCLDMSRAEIVRRLRMWREKATLDVAPGKTRIERDGVVVHVWDSLVRKYALTAADLEGIRFESPFCSYKGDMRYARPPPDEMHRTRDRVDAYKRELMERTWHPTRVAAWCLDAEDAAAIHAEYIDNAPSSSSSAPSSSSWASITADIRRTIADNGVLAHEIHKFFPTGIVCAIDLEALRLEFPEYKVVTLCGFGETSLSRLVLKRI